MVGDLLEIAKTISVDKGVGKAFLVDFVNICEKHSPGIHLAPWPLYEARLRAFYQRWIRPINIPWLPDRMLDRQFENKLVQFFRWIYGKVS